MDYTDLHGIEEALTYIGKSIQASFAHPDADNVTNALYDIAQALRSVARAIRGEKDEAR
jgi:hypothetical protein